MATMVLGPGLRIEGHGHVLWVASAEQVGIAMRLNISLWAANHATAEGYNL